MRSEGSNTTKPYKSRGWRRWGKRLLIVVIVAGVLCVLCVVNIKQILSTPILNTLVSNITFVADVLNNYWGAVLLLILCILLCTAHFKLKLTKISIGGAECEVRISEAEAKSRVKHYLDTKRSLFKFNSEHDDIEDVLNSYYQIYGFLRDQMQNFEVFNLESTECYKQMDSMIGELNLFLTRFQRNYRRWNEIRKKTEDEYRPLNEVQKEYPEYKEINKGFMKLNNGMKKYIEYFGIDADKWNL